MKRIEQYIGPFSTNQSISFSSNVKYKIGFSISEKDFMKRGIFDQKEENNQVVLKINNNEIQMGKTFIYQPGDTLENLTLSFPKGAPDSMIIDVIYMS